jgi:hypothetical protein
MTAQWKPEPLTPKPEAQTPEVATAEDFRAAAEFEPPEPVILPAMKKTLILRRPKPSYFVRMRQQLPQSIAARVQDAQPKQLTPDEWVAMSKFWTQLFIDVFVNPRISTQPGDGGINPNNLVEMEEDTAFLFRWIGGEISGGADLASFRPRSAGASPAAVRPGNDISGNAPQPVPAGVE